MRKMGMVLVAVLALSACASSSGMSANQAQAYTCDQWQHVTDSQTDQQHTDNQAAVAGALLKVHGYPDSPENEGALQSAVDAYCGITARPSDKVDDLDWTGVAGLAH